MTAVEALLVSLYGFRSGSDPPAEETSPSSPLQAAATNRTDSGLTETSHSTGSADVSLEASNCSSSSSVADDWIVARSPAELQPDLPLHDHEATAESAPGRLQGADVSAAETRMKQISAEDWSRGTALTDPASGEPLQPVQIHQPSKQSDEPRSMGKKTLNAITEKRAALMAYDMISNRTTRAPLSPAALFEKETRAEVLKENPAVGLQDISAAVQERWKNLKEEDRKK